MNEFVQQSLGFTEASVQAVVYVSGVSACVVLLAMGLHRAMRRWLPVRAQYLLWMLVILRFVIFVAPESPTSFLNLLPNGDETVTLVANRPVEFISATQPILVDAKPPTVTHSATQYSDSAILAWNSWHWIGAVWMLVTFGLIARLAKEFWRIKKIVESATPVTGGLESRFQRLQKLILRSGRAKLLSTNQLNAPAMFGFWRPVVLVPTWFESELRPEQQEMILAHELIHVRRGDGWVQLVSKLVAAVHWFNPLVRIAVTWLASV